MCVNKELTLTSHRKIFSRIKETKVTSQATKKLPKLPFCKVLEFGIPGRKTKTRNWNLVILPNSWTQKLLIP
jgi:hypothetical protein